MKNTLIVVYHFSFSISALHFSYASMISVCMSAGLKLVDGDEVGIRGDGLKMDSACVVMVLKYFAAGS